jgi:hypothetical protein
VATSYSLAILSRLGVNEINNLGAFEYPDSGVIAVVVDERRSHILGITVSGIENRIDPFIVKKNIPSDHTIQKNT